ncbi:acyl-CoA dehydrogenase family protein [Natrononativus amylolyticus]|uniref:acyl-CoA dehydrogenase family protein n=1 Tax=Natrononativus amylolyticus TaxID=2963434 RepID=UPI0020CC582B|nr:acyl-CoA dehydrogenase family protein [Natrononativus amylolyticus]
MRFTLTDAQREVREEARTVARESIDPVASELDRTEQYPGEILETLGDRGFAGLTVSPAYGGRGDGLTELAILTEELSAAMMPVASALALHLGVAAEVERLGSDGLKEAVLPSMARFETVGALGLTEANAGTDKLAMETTARREGDEWVLSGTKAWVTNYLEADVVLTYAKTGSDADAPHNISAFLVPADAFEVVSVWETLGARSVKSPMVSLSAVRVPDDRRVGEEGAAYARRGESGIGVNLPARGVGVARAALEATLEFTSECERDGKPLADSQAVRHRVAEMAQRVDAARLLTMRAADLLDRGEASGHELRMAKIHATETAVDVANEALRLHGERGYAGENDVERYVRDARLLPIAGGPNDNHRNSLADAVFETGAIP